MITVMNPERAPNDLTSQQCGGSYKIVKLLGRAFPRRERLPVHRSRDGRSATATEFAHAPRRDLVTPPIPSAPDATTPAPAAAMPAQAIATSSSMPASIALAQRGATHSDAPLLDHAPIKPSPSPPVPSAPSTLPRPADKPPSSNQATTILPRGGPAASEGWLIIRIKGGFAEISIGGDKPNTSPRRKRVRVGAHHVVMTGYPDGSETEKRKEFDVTVPAGKDETIIYKTW